MQSGDTPRDEITMKPQSSTPPPTKPLATKLLSTAAATTRWVRAQQADGLTVGFVPTMGALHAGHASLIARAAKQCDRVIVSVFVNPLQFDSKDDLARYPKTLAADRRLIAAAGGTAVFVPSVEEMYPESARTRVIVSDLTTTLCGATRPGHFEGVATVVAKLFNIVPADFAYFGEKDFQQLQVIRRMAQDLNFTIRIVGCKTIREPDGLAMSSRNIHLTPDERAAAPAIYRGLREAASRCAKGERDPHKLIDRFRDIIHAEAPQAQIQYAEIVDPTTLQPLATITNDATMAVAVFFGKTRLIDNMPLTPGKKRP